MSDIEYYARIEEMLEQQISQLKKVLWYPDRQKTIKGLSAFVEKTRELKTRL